MSNENGNDTNDTNDTNGAGRKGAESFELKVGLAEMKTVSVAEHGMGRVVVHDEQRAVLVADRSEPARDRHDIAPVAALVA